MCNMGLLVGCVLLFAVTFIGRVEGNYVYSSSAGSRRLKRFKEYPGLSLIRKTPYLVSKEESDYRVCIRACDLDRATCKAINVQKKTGNFNCNYFNISGGNFEENPDMIYISKDPPACHAYCDQMEFLNICGKCACVNKCGSKFSHFCDCTTALTTPKKNCETIKAEGFTEPAMYNIKNTGGQQFQGFCEEREDSDVLWLTMMRRFQEIVSGGITLAQLRDGFGKPHSEFYWLGLEQLHHFTKNDNTILRIEIATFSHHYRWYGEYGNFKITKTGNTYGYTAEDYRSNFCLWNGFADQGTFGECPGKSDVNPWDGSCAGSEPLATKRIRWGKTVAQRITFLLRHGSLPDIPLPTVETAVEIKPLVLGKIDHFGMDFCVSLNIYPKSVPDNTMFYNILCLSPNTISEKCLLFSLYVTDGLLRFKHTFREDKVKTYVEVNVLANKWINVKISQMKINHSGSYLMRLLVDDVQKVEVKIEDTNLVDQRQLNFYLGATGRFHDGMVHDLYLNGERYL